jgi:hypothetical protein
MDGQSQKKPPFAQDVSAMFEGSGGCARRSWVRAYAMSKLLSVFLVIASQCALAVLGLLILVTITDITHLVTPTNSYVGMNR